MPDDPQIDALKLPPHSLEAEQSVLGGLLLDNEAADRVGDVVFAADFYSEAHRVIYDHIVRLIADGRPADVVTLAESLGSSQKLDYIGGLAYLGALVQNVPTAANIRHYAQIVRDRSILRQLASTAGEIADSAYNPLGRNAKMVLDEAEAKVLHIAEQGSRGTQSFQEIGKLLATVVERIETLYSRDNPSDVTGVPTGYSDLDRMTSGFQPGDLIVVAGRPSMGKAQPLDARVRTPAGWKRMGDLQPGDALASIDGKPSAVTGVFPQGRRQVFRVSFSDGRATECCGEHMWRVHFRSWSSPRVLRTDRVAEMLTRQRYQGRLWIEMPSGDFGSTEKLPIDPWVLGALLGDGDLTQATIRFSSASEHVLTRMRQSVEPELVLNYAGGVDWRIAQRGGAHRRGISGVVANPLTIALKDLGAWGCSSHEKFIPAQYMRADKAARAELLAGLLDTDGWVEKWGSIRFATSSSRLARDVVELARSLGAWCSVQEKSPHFAYLGERRKGRLSYVCTISHPDPASVLMLSDKQTRVRARVRRKMPIFDTIEPTSVSETQCISVSHSSSLYITDDYVVTHNTALALNIGESVALHHKKPVVVFSMEMGATQLALRLIGSVGRLDQHKLRTGRLGPEDWDKLSTALGLLNEAPILIDETPALNAIEVRSRARRIMKQRGELGLVIVDYLQLMQSSSQGENRATEISEISRSMKALAKELQVPVVALSQLNRSLEQRPNKRPVMSDLRECVTGDTLVVTTDGARIPIRDLVGQTPSVWAVDERQKIVAATADLVWSKGVKPVFRVALASGRVLRATAEHRLLAAEGWKRVSEIAIGARVALARGIPTPSEAPEWDEHQLVLLGHLVGDGSYPTHQPLRYTTASEENSAAVRAAAGAMGSDVKRYEGRGNWHQLLITGNGNRWHAAGVGKWLQGSRHLRAAFARQAAACRDIPPGPNQHRHVASSPLGNGRIDLVAQAGNQGCESRVFLHVQRAACGRCRGAPAAPGHRRADSVDAEDWIPSGIQRRRQRHFSATALPRQGRCVRPACRPGGGVARAPRSDGRQYECRHAPDRSVRRREGVDAPTGSHATPNGRHARHVLWRDEPLSVRAKPRDGGVLRRPARRSPTWPDGRVRICSGIGWSRSNPTARKKSSISQSRVRRPGWPTESSVITRARSSRTRTSSCSSIATKSTTRNRRTRVRPRSSSASSATGRSERCGLLSSVSTRDSRVSPRGGSAGACASMRWWDVAHPVAVRFVFLVGPRSRTRSR